MISSESISTLAAALVKAQTAFAPAVKAKANPAFKGSLYVDLASAIDAAQPALLENGIAVIQGASGDVAAQSVTVTTRILHNSGEWIEDSLTLPALNQAGSYNAQTVGSAITYGRRYSYMSILGFAPEDDDGNGAAGNHQKPKPVAKATAPDEPLADDKQIQKLWDRCKEYGITKEKVTTELARAKVTDLKKFPLKAYDEMWVWVAEAA